MHLQPSLAVKAERNGYGKRVDWGDLTAEKLSSAMKEVLSNPSYQKSVDHLSAILRDRLVHPLDEAVYHVEYVMRHGGADFLRSPSKDLYWFQYMLLDVAAFILAVVFILMFIVVKTCRCLCGQVKASKRASDIDKRKKRE